MRRASWQAMPSGLLRRERAASKCRRSSHQRRFALDRRAVHVSAVFLVVERRGAMLRAAVVPQYRVAGTPAMAVDELRSYGEFLQVADQLLAFARGQALDFAGPAAHIERGPAGLRVPARERMPDIRALALVLVAERRQVRVVDVVQPDAAETRAPARDGFPRGRIELLERAVHVREERVAAFRRKLQRMEE